jgi:GT2 family glycosyltransferase
LKPVIGNTAALMMIRKNTFIRVGMFNEGYKTCFEDVELNYGALVLGLTNYCDGSLAAYHYESITRNMDNSKNELERSDLVELLLPFLRKNFNKLKTNILFN